MNAQAAADPLATAAVGRRLALVRQRLTEAASAVGRDPARVTVVVITKGVGEALVSAAYAAGLRHFGENRVQEAVGKIAASRVWEPQPTWHLVGHLQRNKAKVAVAEFGSVDSVDSPRLAQTLNQWAATDKRQLPVLLEVNVSAEAAKHGVPPSEAVPMARMIAGLPHLRLEGLMTVGPHTEDRLAIAAAFRRLAQLQVEVAKQVPGLALHRLSMGMSGDYELAVAAGATEVRIGRALFEDREWP